jgi:hypothetical protein
MRQHYFIYPFGVDGTITPAVPNVDPGTGYVSYQLGWTFDYQRNLLTDPAAKSPTYINMNAVWNDITGALQDLQQNGSPEWIDNTDNGGTAFPYRIGAICRHSSGGTPPFALYWNSVDNNTAVPGADSTWKLFSTLFADTGGRLLNTIYYTAAGTHTYTPIAGANAISVEIIGAGGGGGASPGVGTGSYAAGAGGGSGAYSRNDTIPVSSIGGSLTVTIGGGGAGGAPGGNTGATGGTTLFGSLMSAGGGAGGQGGISTTTTITTAAGGGGAVGSGGSMSEPGRDGDASLIVSAGAICSGGRGAASVYGKGGGGAGGNANGSAGTGGGGGGGGCSLSTAGSSGYSGGNGGDGIVIVREYS